MSYFKLAIGIFLISFLMIGSQIAQTDKENGIQRDIYNYTESTITLPKINISENHPIEKEKGIINEGRLYKIIDAGINFLLISTEQITKMGVEYGYQNPDVNWKVILKYLIYILIIIIILMLLKPIGYLIVFIVLIIIMIKEKRRKKKQKNKGIKKNGDEV